MMRLPVNAKDQPPVTECTEGSYLSRRVALSRTQTVIANHFEAVRKCGKLLRVH